MSNVQCAAQQNLLGHTINRAFRIASFLLPTVLLRPSKLPTTPTPASSTATTGTKNMLKDVFLDPQSRITIMLNNCRLKKNLTMEINSSKYKIFDIVFLFFIVSFKTYCIGLFHVSMYNKQRKASLQLTCQVTERRFGVASDN